MLVFGYSCFLVEKLVGLMVILVSGIVLLLWIFGMCNWIVLIWCVSVRCIVNVVGRFVFRYRCSWDRFVFCCCVDLLSEKLSWIIEWLLWCMVGLVCVIVMGCSVIVCVVL